MQIFSWLVSVFKGLVGFVPFVKPEDDFGERARKQNGTRLLSTAIDEESTLEARQIL
jgi:hypothetical protein